MDQDVEEEERKRLVSLVDLEYLLQWHMQDEEVKREGEKKTPAIAMEEGNE